MPIDLIVTVVCSVLASSGLWAFIQKVHERKDKRTKLLLGIAHDRIIYLGMGYIERGYITHDEYENIVDYLYKPYAALGGNGTAKRVVDELERLMMTKYIQRVESVPDMRMMDPGGKDEKP